MSYKSSDSATPYVPEISSLPEFNKDEGSLPKTPRSRQAVKKEVVSLGISNLRKVSQPAKCCRNAKLNETPIRQLPYPVSLVSLPLDRYDAEFIKNAVKSSS